MATKKTAPKKAEAKKTVKVAKPAPKKAGAKPAPKPVAKAAPKKVAAKPVAKAAPAKKAAAKPVAKAAPAKKVAPKEAPKKVEAKKVVKPVAKAAPRKEIAKKAEPKKAVVKETPKKETKPVVKEVVKAEKPAKPSKPTKAAPVKTVIANNSIPKKSDVFKTNTFGTSNLKNETGKVIAHRKTSELKRKTNDLLDPKKADVEYTRSILDMSTNDSKTSFRYSDEDLVEFRELIVRKLDTAKAELQYLQGVIMRKDESGTEDTENKYQNMEDGSASMDREQFNQLASRQITFITHLEQALVRIENKTYGICRETGKLIDKARLRAVPHATLSIEAKNAKK